MTGKRLAITTGAIAILVLGVAAFVARDRIVEEWWIYQLGSKDNATKIHAAEKLASMDSLAAVPKLLQAIDAEDRESCGYFSGGNGSTYENGICLTPLSHCLYKIGPKASGLIEKWTANYYKIIEDELIINGFYYRKGGGADLITHFIAQAWAEKSNVMRIEYNEN